MVDFSGGEAVVLEKARAVQILFMGHIEMIKDFLFRLLVIVVILWGLLPFFCKRKELFGGFIGGMVIGVLEPYRCLFLTVFF